MRVVAHARRRMRNVRCPVRPGEVINRSFLDVTGLRRCDAPLGPRKVTSSAFAAVAQRRPVR
jgi:hypothetical protein